MSIFFPRGLIVALQFLTRIPTPQRDDFSSADEDTAAIWYPVVGLVIGGVIAGTAWLGMLFSPWLAALAALIAWVWVTGALHLDGLADVADGLGAAHGDPKRFLAVVKDPHVGTFGVVALVLVLLGKTILLSELASAAPVAAWLPALVLVPAWARWGPLVWRQLAPPLGEGRGRAFSQQQDWTWVASHAALLSLASFWFGPALLASILMCPLIALYWRWRMGGMSGDCHGAGIEVTEVVLLASLVVSAG